MIANPPTPALVDEINTRVRRFTLAEWRLMVEKGVLSGKERLEFVEGQIFVTSPVNRPNASCVNRLNALFGQSLGANAIVAIQNPLLVGQDELYPDVVVLKPAADFYDSKDAEPADAYLVVEVADTTLKTDQSFKAAKYAAGGVLEYWVVDLNHQRVWVYLNPQDGAYTHIRAYASGEVLAPVALEIRVAVDAILGKTSA